MLKNQDHVTWAFRVLILLTGNGRLGLVGLNVLHRVEKELRVGVGSVIILPR